MRRLIILLFTMVCSLQSANGQPSIPVGQWHSVSPDAHSVILIGGAEGGLSWQYMPQKVEALKQSGFNVFQTAYFRYEDLPPLLESIELNYFHDVVDWVASHGKDVVIIAHSRGSEAALLTAINNPKVQSVVAIAPGSHVSQSIVADLDTMINNPTSAWQLDGRPLSFAPYQMTQEQIKQTREAATNRQMCSCAKQVYRQTIAKAPSESGIEVKDITSKLLLITSESDPIWPATEMANAMVEQRVEAGLKTTHWLLSGGHMPHTQEGVWDRIINYIK